MTTQEKLEALFDKVRALPEPRQQAAIEALAEIAKDPYVLSEGSLPYSDQRLIAPNAASSCRMRRWPNFSTSHGAEAPAR